MYEVPSKSSGLNADMHALKAPRHSRAFRHPWQALSSARRLCPIQVSFRMLNHQTSMLYVDEHAFSHPGAATRLTYGGCQILYWLTAPPTVTQPCVHEKFDLP